MAYAIRTYGHEIAEASICTVAKKARHPTTNELSTNAGKLPREGK
jgi:hypothetical protein